PRLWLRRRLQYTLRFPRPVSIAAGTDSRPFSEPCPTRFRAIRAIPHARYLPTSARLSGRDNSGSSLYLRQEPRDGIPVVLRPRGRQRLVQQFDRLAAQLFPRGAGFSLGEVLQLQCQQPAPLPGAPVVGIQLQCLTELPDGLLLVLPPLVRGRPRQQGR